MLSVCVLVSPRGDDADDSDSGYYKNRSSSNSTESRTTAAAATRRRESFLEHGSADATLCVRVCTVYVRTYYKHTDTPRTH